MIYILAYITGIISFYAFDCIIGMGNKWGRDYERWDSTCNYRCLKCRVYISNAHPSYCPKCNIPLERMDPRIPLILPSIFWVVALPYVIFENTFSYLDNLKDKRLLKESKKEKMRVAIEKEIDDSMKELEKEIRSNAVAKAKG